MPSDEHIASQLPALPEDVPAAPAAAGDAGSQLYSGAACSAAAWMLEVLKSGRDGCQLAKESPAGGYQKPHKDNS